MKKRKEISEQASARSPCRQLCLNIQRGLSQDCVMAADTPTYRQLLAELRVVGFGLVCNCLVLLFFFF